MIKNKFLVKLIVAICLFFTLINCMGTNKVHAKNTKEEVVWGGVLIKPIVNLMTAIGDSIMEILHDSIQQQRQAIIKIDGSESSKSALARFGAVLVGLLAAVGFIAAVVLAGWAVGVIGTAIDMTTAGAVVTVGTLVRSVSHWYSCRKSCL